MPRSPNHALTSQQGDPPPAASKITSHAKTAGDASSSNASLLPPSESKSKNQQHQQGQQDHQHAVDLYQKGMEIAHNASTYDDHCRAIEHFSLAIAIRGDQARFFLARGNGFRAINELEHAARDYGAAITLDDRCALYYANRGACYRKLNQPVRALQDLTAAIDVDGRKGPHYLNRALVLQDSGFYREAIADFTKALDDGSSGGGGAGGALGIGIRLEYRALQGRGFCFRRVGNLPKCIDDLQAAIKLDARSSSGFSALALAYIESGDFDLAIEFLSRAIETNAANASYYSHRGICYYRKGDLFARQCLADLNRCIQLDGGDPQAYFYRGAVRLALALGLGSSAGTTSSNQAASPPAKAPSSASSLSTITPTAPPVIPSSLSAGGFLTPAEQLEAAYADVEMAWTLSATRPQYQTGMAMILQLKHKYEEAVTLLLAVSERERDSVLVKYHLALCCCVLNDYERALSLLTDAVEGLPTEPLFVETRGQLLQELECHELAIRDFTAAISIREGGESAPENGSNNSSDRNSVTGVAVNYYLRGESFLRLKEFQCALNDCSRAIDLGYLDVSALNARAMAFRGLGKLDRAIDDLNVSSQVCLYASAAAGHC
jgi:tetratricopeptide (TPR) repeat protein